MRNIEKLKNISLVVGVAICLGTTIAVFITFMVAMPYNWTVTISMNSLNEAIPECVMLAVGIILGGIAFIRLTKPR